MDSGWDVKHLLKLIVTSATYRQSSSATEQRCGKLDPDNRWLARQGRFRLDAELIRDNALADQRPVVAEDRRPERQALSTGRLLGAI